MMNFLFGTTSLNLDSVPLYSPVTLAMRMLHRDFQNLAHNLPEKSQGTLLLSFFLSFFLLNHPKLPEVFVVQLLSITLTLAIYLSLRSPGSPKTLAVQGSSEGRNGAGEMP